MSTTRVAPCAPPAPDVALAVSALGLRARSWTPITSLGGGTRRVAYRVTLDDGRIVKVRRVLDDARSARAVRIRDSAALPGLVPLLAHREAVWVEAWIDGHPPRTDPPDPRQLDQVAELLAALHAVEPAGLEPLRTRRDAREWREATKEHLAALRLAGVLGARDAAALHDALLREDPGRVAYGLTHGDPAPDNLVVDAGGRLHWIDNEALGEGPLDLDLATLACRWPMPVACLEALVERYAQCAGRRPEALGWWQIVASAMSAAVRVARYPASASPAIARLRAVARRVAEAPFQEGMT